MHSEEPAFQPGTNHSDSRVRTVFEQVWSPTQHLALWLAAWVSGNATSDDVSWALQQFAENHQLDRQDLAPDHVWYQTTDLQPLTRLELLTRIRQCYTDWNESSAPLDKSPARDPFPVRLILSGPGDPPRLPAGSKAAQLAGLSGSAIVFACGTTAVGSSDPAFSALIPPVQQNQPWTWVEDIGVLPDSDYLSPGAADLLLADATRLAASQIDLTGADVSGTIPNPRLLVGTLQDHMDLAYIPDTVPQRSARLFARADTVAAILTAAGHDEFSAYDPQLFPLWRPIRQARIAAFEYALTQWFELD